MINVLITFIFRETLIISVLFGCIELMKIICKKVYPKVYIWLHALAVFGAVLAEPVSIIWQQIWGMSGTNTGSVTPVMISEKSVQLGTTAAPVQISGDRKYFWIIVAIWLAGSLVFLGYHMIQYIQVKRKLFIWSHDAGNLYNFCGQLGIQVKEKYKDVHIRVCDLPCSPLLIGYKKTYLYLPNIDMRYSDKKLVIQHEITHFNHHDLYWKAFFLLVHAINWFNPLMFIFGKRIDEEIELACDYAVTHTVESVSPEEYAEMILAVLKMAGTIKHPLTTCFSKSAQHIRKRFQFLLENTKRERKVVALTSFLCLMLVTQFVIQCDVTTNSFKDSYVEIQRNVSGKMQTEKLCFNELYYQIRDLQGEGDGQIYDIKSKEKIKVNPGESLLLYATSDGTEFSIHENDVVDIKFNLQAENANFG